MTQETLFTSERSDSLIPLRVKQRERMWSFVENERARFEMIRGVRLRNHHSAVNKSAIHQDFMVVVLFVLTICLRPFGSQACPASPFPFRQQQPNNQMEQLFYLHGDASYNYLTDINGFTVMRDDYGMLVYARRNSSSGYLMATDMVVGNVDPITLNLTTHTRPAGEIMKEVCGRMCGHQNSDQVKSLKIFSRGTRLSSFASASVPDIVVRKNLVLLIRFSNHASRELPLPTDIDILFNKVGQHPRIAPTGSVRDVFLTSSLGKLELDSIVYPEWIDLPEPENYYAAGKSGLSTLFMEAVGEALQHLDSVLSFPLAQVDGDGDFIVDTLTLLHSGFGAESGGTDEDGVSFENRIWSHKYILPSLSQWHSREGYQVISYSVSPSLFGTSGKEMGRIGVIAHEIGHILGAPDLYGGNMGNGLGSFGLMANSWGFDFSQLYPPIMCPWTKKLLGWLEIKEIAKGGRYSIQASATFNDVYQINLNNAGTEYLLVENRQPVGFDAKLPQGGLAIWHIDELAEHRDDGGWPGQRGWPSNGNHYKVALLQADGNYDLEQAHNRGDKGDLFHAEGVAELLPSLRNGSRYPNTDAYQGGIVRSTGIAIIDISSSSDEMQFSIVFDNEKSSSPIESPTVQEQVLELKTLFEGNNGASGVMFDVVPLQGIHLVGVSVYMYSLEKVGIEIFHKQGSHVGFERDLNAWVKVSEQQIQGNGFDESVDVTIPHIPLLSAEPIALYITLTTDDRLSYTEGTGTGSISASNSHMQIIEGVGKSYPFAKTYRNRQWNGALRYVLNDTLDERLILASTWNKTWEPTSILTSTLSSQKLVTTFVGGSEQAGHMFDVLAFRDIFVTSFDLHISVTDEVVVEIYTKVDSYSGVETVCDAWTTIASIQVQGQGRGTPTPLPPHSFPPIPLSKFLVHSFYITIRTSDSSGMQYLRGSGSGSLVASDEFLAVFEGIGKGYLYAETVQDCIWNGIIHYLPETINPRDPVSTSSTAVSLPATIVESSHVAGFMFDLFCKKAILITGMKLHIDVTTEVHVEIYTKSESYLYFDTLASAWTMIMSAEITGRGQGNQTSLSPHSFAPIALQAGDTLGLYVTCSLNVMCFSTHHVDIESNEAYMISNGISKSCPFGKSSQNRVWNGVIEYELI